MGVYMARALKLGDQLSESRIEFGGPAREKVGVRARTVGRNIRYDRNRPNLEPTVGEGFAPTTLSAVRSAKGFASHRIGATSSSCFWIFAWAALWRPFFGLR